jgi:hypothetical protein
MTAIGLFKDWSNILLTTTVVALGWVTSGNRIHKSLPMKMAAGSLCASVVFGIFTLALVPSVAEKLAEHPGPIYQTEGLLYLFGPFATPMSVKLVFLCWPQHALFLVGVVIYVIGVLRAPEAAPVRAP